VRLGFGWGSAKALLALAPTVNKLPTKTQSPNIRPCDSGLVLFMQSLLVVVVDSVETEEISGKNEDS
jgi:uncharacterized membrane protein required for colicin V production